jgi:leader peptidase (prepilin peptidase)/N-methyltransferase
VLAADLGGGLLPSVLTAGLGGGLLPSVLTAGLGGGLLGPPLCATAAGYTRAGRPADRHATAATPSIPAVAAVTGAVLATLATAASGPWQFAAYAWVGAFGVCLGFVDAAVRRLPDPLTLPAFGGAVVLLALDRPGALPAALLGALGMAGCYLLLILIHPPGMGLGDAKLALALGALLGPHGPGAVALGTAAGFALAGLYAAALLLLRRATRRTQLPHGPFMLLGTLVTLLMTTATAAG